MNILNFGSLNIDFVYQVDHHVRNGETLSSFVMEKFCGGKGLNQSIALRKAGADVFHAGCIGMDGVMLREFLDKNGVDCSLVKTVDDASGHAIIQVDKNGENCILLYGGANLKVSLFQIDEVLKKFKTGDLLLIQNEINNLEYIVDKAYEKGMIIALNPSPINENVFNLPLEKITYFILNEIEGMGITGREDPKEILSGMKRRFKNSRIVLTLGGKGAVYEDENQHITQNCYQVEAVDTTAAGDTFTGYFLALVMQGRAAGEALDIAAKAAAISVSRMGAAPSIPLIDEVLKADIILKTK